MSERRHKVIWAALLAALLLIPNAYAIQQYRATGGYLFYANAFDEPTYLSYDGATITRSPTRWAEYLVLAFHRVGLSGGYTNLVFDIIFPILTVVVLRQIALMLGFSAAEAVVYPFLVVSIPVLLGYANPYYGRLFELNYHSKGLSWITLPQAYYPPFFRSPEPQISLCVAAIATYAALRWRSYLIALAVVPCLYPFVAVPYMFVVVALALHRRMAMRLSTALILSYATIAAGILAFFMLFVSGTRLAEFLPFTRLPLLSGTAVVALAIYLLARRRLESRYREPALCLALAPLAAANTQLISGFVQVPNGAEQSFGVVAVGIVCVLALRTIGYRGLMPPAAAVASCLLLATYSAFVFDVNASVWQGQRPSRELLDALRRDPDGVIISDPDLADMFALVAPRLHFSALARSRTLRSDDASNGNVSTAGRWSTYLCLKRLLPSSELSAASMRSTIDVLDRGFRYLGQDFPLIHLNRRTDFTQYFDPSQRAGTCPARQLQVFPDLILGVEVAPVPLPPSIVTPAGQWEYAALLPLPDQSNGKRLSHRLAAVRAKLTVTRGCIGLGVLEADGRSFVGQSSLTSAPDDQVADVPFAPGPEPHLFVVRNCSPDGSSSAIIHSVDVFPVAAVTLRSLNPRSASEQ